MDTGELIRGRIVAAETFVRRSSWVDLERDQGAPNCARRLRSGATSRISYRGEASPARRGRRTGGGLKPLPMIGGEDGGEREAELRSI